MILQGTKSRTWSRTSSWVSLALGAMLLPLMPTWAQPQRSQAQQPVRDDAEVRVSQARTQLIEVQLAPGQEAQDPGSRLQELEKKVDALRKEIEALRRELGAALAANRATKKSFERMFIDLQPWANQKLDETFHSQQYPGNNLASLPTGVQTLDGMTFKIGKQLIQLGTRIDKPAKVEGIKMDRKLSKLHILHATGYSVDDDTQIAEYTINYENGTSVTIPVVYGQDVLDWWKYSFSGEPTRGKVVWNGENEPAKKEFDATIRLYVTTWENPKPNLKIVSIDYAATGETQCVPFCVALTGEN